jgi:hypothetical protein
MANFPSASLQLCLHFHQPLYSTKEQLQEITESTYWPLLKTLDAMPNAQLSLSISGYLLEHFNRHEQDLLRLIKKLVERSQLEILGGLFYNGIPALLPQADIEAQLAMTTEFYVQWFDNKIKSIFIPECTIPPELPRLLANTEACYTFIADKYLPDTQRNIAAGIWHRGHHAMVCYIVHTALQRMLSDNVASETWIAQFLDSTHKMLGQPITVIASASSWENSTFNTAWLKNICQHPDIQMTTPQCTWKTLSPYPPLQLDHGHVSDSQGLKNAGMPPFSWSRYLAQHHEIDTIYRRMLRASSKVYYCIGIMEEEKWDVEWNDRLATAQRWVCMAQNSDLYWPKPDPNTHCGHPELRKKMCQGLIEAEKTIDALIYPQHENWLDIETYPSEELAEEVWLSSKDLQLCILPHQGGRIKALDDKRTSYDILDLAGYAQGLRYLPLPLPMTSEAYFLATSPTLLPSTMQWHIATQGAHPEEESSYGLSIRGAPAPYLLKNNLYPQQNHAIELDFSMKMDVPGFYYDSRIQCQAETAQCKWGIEIPLSSSLQEQCILQIDGKTTALEPSAYQDISSICWSLSAEKPGLRIDFKQPVGLWCAPIIIQNSTKKEILGWRLFAWVTCITAATLCIELQLSAH